MSWRGRNYSREESVLQLVRGVFFFKNDFPGTWVVLQEFRKHMTRFALIKHSISSILNNRFFYQILMHDA